MTNLKVVTETSGVLVMRNFIIRQEKKQVVLMEDIDVYSKDCRPVAVSRCVVLEEDLRLSRLYVYAIRKDIDTLIAANK